MPKSSKKQKDKAADFTKAKLKLGKGKQTPSNVVDTSFKYHSIALPTQSITSEKAQQAPTTKRKLTLEELTAHLKHYNSGTRRDALLGLRELLDAHPELIIPNLTILVNSCVRLIADEDASVRKTLLAFLGWLLPRIPVEDLVPHSPVLLLFTTSAQTHIFPEIRIDAIRFLNLFLELIPVIVTEGWVKSRESHGRRILEGYLGILNAGTIFGEGGDTGPVQATSTASVVLSAASKLIVLKSLGFFLRRALTTSADQATSSASTLETPTWFFSSSFSSPAAFHTFDSLLRPLCSNSGSSYRSSRTWMSEVHRETQLEDFQGNFDFARTPIESLWGINEMSEVNLQDFDLQQENVNATSLFAAHLARTLHSTLVSTFLDCAPSVFSPTLSPPETELQMVQAVGDICLSLYSAVFRDTQKDSSAGRAIEDLRTILGYFAPYFPFKPGTSFLSNARRDIRVEQTFQELNITYCELTSFVALAPIHLDRGSTSRLARTSNAAAELQISHVSAYVASLLRGEVSESSQPSLVRPITPAGYAALLPTIWSLLNTPDAVTAATLEQTSPTTLCVVVDHAIKASSTSAVKRSTVDFLARLVLLEREQEYCGVFRIGRNSEEDRKLVDWILHLPKTLWELGASSLPTTEIILRFLLRLSQRRSSLLRDQILSSLRARLLPYFLVVHNTRGQLPGPYTKLPAASPVRILALDVAAVFLKCSKLEDGLQDAVHIAVQGTMEQSYWESVCVET